MTDYQTDGADGGVYLYPALGDPRPRPGAKVQLLTRGGVHTSGAWDDSGRYMAWLSLPRRDKAKEAVLALIPT